MGQKKSKHGFKPMIQKHELKKGMSFDWKETGRYHIERSFYDDYFLENEGESVLGSGYNGVVSSVSFM